MDELFIKRYGLGIIIVIAAGWKFALLSIEAFPFNSDEAIVGLMAKHILSGELPTFFYGQAYMGSLDAILVAGGFYIFGAEIWVIRLIQIILFLGTIVTTAMIGKLIWRWEVGLLGAGLLAVPTVNATLYTTVSLGGYGETLLLGNLILLLTLQILEKIQRQPQSFAAVHYFWFGGLGGLVGFGWWVNGMTLVYSLPSILILLYFMIKNKLPVRAFAKFLIPMILGLIIGSFPIILYGINYGFTSIFTELFGSAVSVETGTYVHRVFSHSLNFFLLGLSVILGLRPPWEVRWLALPLIPLIILLWIMVARFVVIQVLSPEKKPGIFLLLGVCATLIGGFVFTSFGIDPSGRYTIPLIVPMSLFCAAWIYEKFKSTKLMVLLITILLGFNVWGTLNCAMKNPPGITTQFDAVAQIDHEFDEELARFLLKHHEYYGYTNYWVAYPLSFKTDESLIYIPRLPYHQDFRYTSRDNRYHPYTDIVKNAERIAYITTNHTALNAHLRMEFSNLRITWKEAVIGDYQIFYQLSEVVKPDQIGLGQ